jgi:cation transport regulator ChaC
LEDTPPKVVEVIKEVPVDRVVIQEKIVETIKEVPVEVIKEVIVEKESDGNWKPKLEALQNTVQKLKQDNIEKDRQLKEYEKTIEEIQKFQQDKKAAFLRGSNLNDTLYK